MDPSKVRVEKTGWSGLWLILIPILILIAAGAVAWIFYTNPEILKDVVMVILIIIAAIVIVVIVIWALALLLAIPIYVKKGATYQTDMKYDIDDVKSVKESSGSDKKEEK